MDFKNELLDKLDDIITKALDESNNQVECQTLRWVLDVISKLRSHIYTEEECNKQLEEVIMNRYNIDPALIDKAVKLFTESMEKVMKENDAMLYERYLL